MSWSWMRRLLALLVSCLAAAGAAQAQLADPWADWQSADSAHFRVHYRSTQRAQAEAVARAAERAYPRVTEALQWEPRSRTELVVYTELDVANGFTTPLPFGLIGVFLAPPDEGQLLDNSPWLELLLVHEFTHAVHLDKVRGAPRILQSIFGNVPWFIPNLLAPGWMLEGIAVYNESDSAAGRGRLRGPLFEAWLRAEKAQGFVKLAELNSDGRRLPLAKQYLYGAYFFDFLARRYGTDKPLAFIERYSGNIVPRLHSGPYDATGKMMDELWDEFLADLGQQVDAHAAAIVARPESLSEKVLGPLFDIGSVATLPDGALVAATDDGLGRGQLLRLGRDGSRRVLADLTAGARVSAGPDGRMLVAQLDICDTVYLAYDLYRVEEGGGLRALSHCAHLRRGVDFAGGIAALQLDGGRTSLVALESDGGKPRPLWAPPAGTDLVDLAPTAGGTRLAVVTHRGADWRVVEIDPAQPQAAPRLLLRRASPISSLRAGAQGLEMVLVEDGQANVWRLAGARLERLTHNHTAVVEQAGSAADGSLAAVLISAGGYELRRQGAAAPLQTLAADTRDAAPAAAEAAGENPLGEGRSYAAWRSVYPRSWLPAISADRGLTAYGASTTGGDALGWHAYAALLQWETSQHEPIGMLEYLFLGEHEFALTRSLSARAWTGDSGHETTTVYDRRTRAQWVSQLPWLRLDRRVRFGIGAAADRVERVDVDAATGTRLRDERVAAALFDLDTRGANWYSEGPNHGGRATVLYETYRPFAHHTADTAPAYDGAVLRADLRGFVPLGRTVLALRWTEAHASGTTEPFQLGGATDEQLQYGPVLDSRTLAFRGYRGNEPELVGRNARIATVEWRTPLADIDRHAMVPPFGIDRLSAMTFLEAGGAWSAGSGPDRWRKSVGFELLGEVRALYALGLELRVGVARALDEPKGTRAYLRIGRGF